MDTASGSSAPYRAYQTRKRQTGERTIARAKHDKKNPYVKISNKVATDTRLSFEARGLMLYLLSKKDDWVIRPTDLKKQGLGGKDRWRRVRRELHDAGYITQDAEQSRNDDGTFGPRLWRVRETPAIEFPEVPLSDNPPAVESPAVEPSTEQPQAENPPHINDESEQLPNQESLNEASNQSSNDERDVFILNLIGSYSDGYENARDELREQFDRLGEGLFKSVIQRCHKRSPKDIQYFVTALGREKTPIPLPPSPVQTEETLRSDGDDTSYPAFITASAMLIYDHPRQWEHEAWELAYSQLELQLDRANFDTWLRGASFLRVEDGVFVIGVRNGYSRDMLQHRLYRNVWRVLSDAYGEDVEIRFEIASMQPPGSRWTGERSMAEVVAEGAV
jgi:hypothetical protein